MSEQTRDPRHVWRIVPCLPYDVEGMESWLTDQSERGLHLSRDGFFAGFAIFEKGEPHRWIYRYEALQKAAGVLDTSVDIPDAEALEISEEYGWEFVVRRGDFYIYRTDRTDTRELNTDPDVHALALKAVEKRLRSTFHTTFFWVVIYPLLGHLDGDGILRPVITLGTGFCLAGAALSVWILIDLIVRIVHLSKLRKRLKVEGYLDHRKNWQKSALRNHVLRISQIVLIIVWFCILLSRFGSAIMEEMKVTLTDYDKEPPFATFADICPAGEYEEDPMFEPNYIIEWSDWLSPYNAEWMECAKVTLPDGGFVNGTLYIDYHETRAPFLARGLAREYHFKDKIDEFNWKNRWIEDDYQELPLPDDLGVDYAIAYMDWLHFPTVILVEEGRIIKVRIHFYQQSNALPVEEWARVFADSLQR